MKDTKTYLKLKLNNLEMYENLKISKKYQIQIII